MQEIKSLICTECEGKIENSEGSYICSVCGKVYDYPSDFEENEKNQSELWEEDEKRNRIIVIATCILIICAFVSWWISSPFNNIYNQSVSQNNNKAGIEKSSPQKEYSENQMEVEEKKVTSTKKVELPDSLFFMTDLDPIDNGNGTYSFYGYVTDFKTSQYSSYPTTYITTLNGKHFSTGATEFIHQIYIRKDGTYGTIGADAMHSPYMLRDILFKITYDNSGNLIEIFQQ